MPRFRDHLPELGLALTLLFFAFRELGTFPAPWEDDSLFMIVAKRLAMGHGYVLPVLHSEWAYPYILAIGPTLIVPSAIAIKLFGFSVWVARLPMVGYLLATSAVFYLYTRRIAGRWAAIAATGLLISFSAYVNTGKPLLGEIPGFFFFLLGLLALEKGMKDGWKWGVAGGILFGLSVVTKLTYGLIFPAIGIAWLAVLWQRQWKELRAITLIGCTAVLTFLLFGPSIGMLDPAFLSELNQYGFADSGSNSFQVLRTNPALLLRFQYLYFDVLLLLGGIGLWQVRQKISRLHLAIVVSIIVLFMLFFINERGFYRHLLLAHLPLLAFVPTGALSLLRKRNATILLSFFILAQFLWQLDYRGSRRGGSYADAAAFVEKNLQDTDMVTSQPEVFVLLSDNPRWLFLSDEFSIRNYPRFNDLPVRQDQHCLPLLRKISDQDAAIYGDRLKPVAPKYGLIEPPASCATLP